MVSVSCCVIFDCVVSTGIRPELLQYCVEHMGERERAMSREDFHNEMRQRLKSADVVCSTCVGAGAENLDKNKFEAVLVDECTQATEAAVMCSITKGCQQLVLVGDHCQLPPVISCPHLTVIPQRRLEAFSTQFLMPTNPHFFSRP